jgi:three-Cys-motif partner protein
MAAAEPDNFFNQKRTVGEIKDKILPLYFKSWCENYLINQENQSTSEEIAFYDLQAGEGITAEGYPASPIIILNQLYQASDTEPDWRQGVKCCFTDSSDAVVEKLRNNLEQLPFYPELPHVPMTLTRNEFQEQWAGSGAGGRPALLFFNPANQLLTRQIAAQVLQHSQTDAFMVFNLNKLRTALLPDEAAEIPSRFWGSRLNEVIKNYSTENNAKKREQYFLQTLEGVFQDNSFYTLKFNVTAPGKNAASQYLFLATKSLSNYFALKEILQAYSQYQEDGVPLFEASPKPQPPLLPGFFSYLHPNCIENLTEELAGGRSRFHYKTLQAVYEEHSIGTNYIKANYKVALEKLQARGLLYPVDIQNRKVKAFTDSSVIFYNLHGVKK